ncbi:uncharacterized protein LOC130657408 isoform X2 [Hydractinia symbiolongicarpus]|uniref:uncharacterized protein LOC130657408 isoform X2 n=1 Tax=Hydractinia symbiolongicarpus TaxID=13093 RepID=UPI00255085CB|nr:uncharacterized protein LOC130657408 isoform X2 [Hydractinia symbiolongicarpus]
MTQKIFEKYRNPMETIEKNAYVEKMEEEAIVKEAGGRKATSLLSNARTKAKNDEQLKQYQLQIIEKKKETKNKDDEDDESEEEEEVVEIEEPVIDEAAEAEFRRRVMEELQESFKLFDINGDGKISLHELISVMNSVGAGVSMEDAQEILELVDEDGDGEISFEEFKKVMHEKMVQGTVEEDLQAAFQVFDADNDGFISPSEVQSLFLKLGEMITINEAADIMQTCDLNQDGLIDFEEFKLFYNRVLGHHTKATLAVPSSNNNNMDDPGSFTFG